MATKPGLDAREYSTYAGEPRWYLMLACYEGSRYSQQPRSSMDLFAEFLSPHHHRRSPLLPMKLLLGISYDESAASATETCSSRDSLRVRLPTFVELTCFVQWLICRYEDLRREARSVETSRALILNDPIAHKGGIQIDNQRVRHDVGRHTP